MAKERNLPSKTTLTTSDYIRVVGSDNASYKQLLSDVADKVLSAFPYSTKSITLNSNAVAGGNSSFCYKRGNTVTVFLDFSLAQGGTSATIATLPSEYRPPINIRASLPPLNTGTDAGISYALIQANGDIIAYQGSATRAFLLVTFAA